MAFSEHSPAMAIGGDDLEARLHVYLGIPMGDREPEDGSGEFTRQWASLIYDLRAELVALRSESERIGRIPPDYPRHVNWVMRAISVLLPWYTRPLVNFGRRAVSTAELTLELLDAVRQHQDALAEEIRQLRSPECKFTS